MSRSFPVLSRLQRAALAVVLILIGLTGAYGYRNAKREMTDAVLTKRDSIANLVATVLAEKFDRVIDVGVSLSTRVRFVQLIEDGRWSEAVKIQSAVPSLLAYVDRVTLYDPHGVAMASAPQLDTGRGNDPAATAWYRDVMQAGVPRVSDILQRIGDQPVDIIAVGVPIKNQSGRLLGALAVEIKPEAFSRWFKDAAPDPSWHLTIVDQHGRSAFQSDRPPQARVADLSQRPAVQRVLKGDRGIDVVSGVGSETLVTAHVPVDRYGWGVVLDEPAATAFFARDAELRRFAVIYGLMWLSCGIAVFLLFRAKHEARLKAELEQLVSERTIELEASNKELEAFSYSVSHDLRAPLRSIDGFSAMLMEDCKDKLSDQDGQHLRRIRAAAKRMGELIDDLLKLARVTRAEINRNAVDLSALARTINDDLAAANPGRDVAVVIQPDLTVESDLPLLRVMLENLFGNAWKFTGKTPGARIEFGVEANALGRRVFYVRDNGAGFDMNHASRLFNAFQRLHRAEDFQGTGIGLATVQRVVRRLGGRIWADAKVDHGATFYFSLPMAKSPAREAEGLAATS